MVNADKIFSRTSAAKFSDTCTRNDAQGRGSALEASIMAAC